MALTAVAHAFVGYLGRRSVPAVDWTTSPPVEADDNAALPRESTTSPPKLLNFELHTCAGMNELWESTDSVRWTKVLKDLPERVEKKGKDGYPTLHRWFYDDLPKRVAENRYIEKCDLVEIVKWKLKKGTWRPKLLAFAEAADEDEVKTLSKQAYSTLKSAADGTEQTYKLAVQQALGILTKMKGVGPATASAILTAAYPQIPYMADEGMDVAIGKPREYTVKRYLEFALALREKAEALSSKHSLWSAQDVEKALQSEALALKGPDQKRRRIK